MRYIKTQSFYTLFPFSPHTLERACNYAPANVSAVADEVFSRLTQVPSVNQAWYLTAVQSDFGTAVGRIPPLAKSSFTAPARLGFCFTRTIDGEIPGAFDMVDVNVRRSGSIMYDGVPTKPRGLPYFITVRLSPSDCRLLGVTDFSIQSMIALYTLVGVSITNRLRQRMLSRNGSTNKYAAVRQTAYDVWGATPDMWDTPLLTPAHVERSAEVGIRNIRYARPSLIRKYVFGDGMLAERLQAIIRDVRSRNVPAALLEVEASRYAACDAALNLIMVDPASFIMKEQRFMAKLEALCTQQ